MSDKIEAHFKALHHQRKPGKGIPMTATVHGNYRYYRGRCAGHAQSIASDAHKRVAISFTSDQIEAINRVAEKRRSSFSKAVSDLVSVALGGEEE